ncbi:MAG TPA: hypothetical protein VEA79_14165, partial [Phenylobacterium sp.]|nr:hypothetical protein [Phenylobacterium sp.]
KSGRPGGAFAAQSVFFERPREISDPRRSAALADNLAAAYATAGCAREAAAGDQTEALSPG